MKKYLLLLIILLSFNIAKANQAVITAYFAEPIRAPQELALYYQDYKLATISLYGSTVSRMQWRIEDIFGSQEVFEEEKDELFVYANGKTISVQAYTYEPFDRLRYHAE